MSDVMSETCPRSYDKFTCLNCGHTTYGSGGGKKEYCHLCVNGYIKQLKAKIDALRGETRLTPSVGDNMQEYVKAKREELKHPEDCTLNSTLVELETVLNYFETALYYIEQLEDKINALRWVPVSEGQLEDGVEVWLCNMNANIQSKTGKGFYSKGTKTWIWYGRNSTEATHYMPIILPEPDSAKGGQR